MFCPNCGTQNPDTAQACSKCAFHLKGASAPKFKGTMLMMTQPGVTPGAPPGPQPGAAKPAGVPGAVGAVGPAPVGGGASSGRTIVGVAPPRGSERASEGRVLEAHAATRPRPRDSAHRYAGHAAGRRGTRGATCRRIFAARRARTSGRQSTSAVLVAADQGLPGGGGGGSRHAEPKCGGGAISVWASGEDLPERRPDSHTFGPNKAREASGAPPGGRRPRTVCRRGRGVMGRRQGRGLMGLRQVPHKRGMARRRIQYGPPNPYAQRGYGPPPGAQGQPAG